MLAIIQIAGKQFVVEEGKSLYVPHLAGTTGDTLTFDNVLLTHTEGKLGVGSSAKGKVTARLINDLVKGDKLIAFKMKRRKGFRKKHGHRTQYSHIKVENIT